MSKNAIKFTLPVGAWIGNLRHLGNGEFVYVRHDAVKRPVSEGGDSPFQVIWDITSLDGGIQYIRADFCEDGLLSDDRAQRGAAFVDIFYDGKLAFRCGNGTESETLPLEAIDDIARFVGLGTPTTSDWIDANTQPATLGWYERKTQSDDVMCMSFWNGAKWYPTFNVVKASLGAPHGVEFIRGTDAAERGGAPADAPWRGKTPDLSAPLPSAPIEN